METCLQTTFHETEQERILTGKGNFDFINGLILKIHNDYDHMDRMVYRVVDPKACLLNKHFPKQTRQVCYPSIWYVQGKQKHNPLP